ncbi:MAG: NnrS family protein [Candidatus Methylumidiphilus sp.]
MFRLIFSYAFRPFFLLVAAYALLMLLAWASYLSGIMGWPDGLLPRVRHGHEMIFGFAGGAVAGFLLTAVATWTNRPPVAGAALMALCLAWGLARLGGFLPGAFGWVAWGLSSLVFWGGLLALLGREIIGARNARNYKALALLSAFLATEATFFMAAGQNVELQEGCLRAGIFLLLGMVVLVGGRIIPAFTQNWLDQNRPERGARIPSFDRIDGGAVAVTALFAVGFVFWPGAALTGALGLAAAAAQAARLWRWQGWLAGREPLLWVLHVGFAWLPVGFALLGASILGAPVLWESGIHALAYGTVGTLILGVAARVALGHTGRPLRASPLMALAFALITLGTLCRILAQPGHGVWMTLSVALWLAAYGLFLIQYVPILLSPRASDA